MVSWKLAAEMNESVESEALVMPSKQRPAGGRAPAVGDDAIVLLAEAELVHLLVEQELGIADVLDLDPAHHLANDRFDVLVVDVDALQAIDLLNGVDQVRLRVLLAEDREQVVGIERPVNEGLAGADILALLHVDVDAASDGVFLLRLAVFALDVDLAQALADFAVFDDAVDFADDRGIAGLARFE